MNSESLHVHFESCNNSITIKLKGQIDEDASYPRLALEGVSTIEFDMGGVTLINSTGLQGWVKFVGSFPNTIDLIFSKCPIRVINQLNLFPDFFAGRDVSIASFEAPYYCETCEKTKAVLLYPSVDFQDNAPNDAPNKICQDCNKELEFDGLEKKYFCFLG